LKRQIKRKKGREEEEGTGITSDGARGKRRGLSPGAAARHSQIARV